MRWPKRSMCAAILVLQAIVLGLTVPVLITVAEVDTTVAVVGGLGLALLCVLTAGLLRKSWAYGLGWGIQVAATGLGIWIPAMIALGLVFAALWATAYFLGERIERERAAYESGAAER